MTKAETDYSTNNNLHNENIHHGETLSCPGKYQMLALD